VQAYAESEFNSDFSKPEKILLIGSNTFEDILFGRLNGMGTILTTDLNFMLSNIFFAMRRGFKYKHKPKLCLEMNFCKKIIQSGPIKHKESD